MGNSRSGRPKTPKPENNQTLAKVNKSVPSCPSWLDPIAQKIWDETSKELEAMGVINKIDLPILALYCDGYSKYLKANIESRKEFSNQKDKIANYNYQRQSYTQVVVCAKELGITPSARSKLVVTNVEDTNNWSDTKGLLGGK